MPLHNRDKSFFAEDAAGHCQQMGQDLVNGPYNGAMQDAAEIVDQSVRDSFNSSASPDGVNWPPRKRVGDGHPLLMDEGDLLQAATGGGPGHIERAGPYDLQIGVDGNVIPYAGIHNDGGQTRLMPQREYLGLHEQGKDDVEDLLAAYVLREVFG